MILVVVAGLGLLNSLVSTDARMLQDMETLEKQLAESGLELSESNSKFATDVATLKAQLVDNTSRLVNDVTSLECKLENQDASTAEQMESLQNANKRLQIDMTAVAEQSRVKDVTLQQATARHGIEIESIEASYRKQESQLEENNRALEVKITSLALKLADKENHLGQEEWLELKAQLEVSGQFGL